MAVMDSWAQRSQRSDMKETSTLSHNHMGVTSSGSWVQGQHPLRSQM